jgi:hypothetical protein
MDNDEYINLLHKAEELGIINIDIDGSELTIEALKAAIEATEQLNLKIDKELTELLAKCLTS